MNGAPSVNADPRLAIVIPVFRHSVLLVDAIEAALAQRTPFGFRVVLVNDGCPFPETEAVCRDYARACPERVSYLRKPNGGLSDARNHGIRHVLTHWPGIEALYMLDADNRLHPDAMARAMAALDTDPQVDWIYPNIDMFGMTWAGDYGGPYSQLIHSAMNICEAGSLIHRRVFEAGILFDTEFRMGWEDWDFFLTAARHGFRGRNLEDFGFLYRKRPESMLADSERDMAFLSGTMHDKHKPLTRPAALLALEAEEAPRYAIVLPDREQVLICTDPLRSPVETLTFASFEHRIWQAVVAPGRFRTPPFTCVMPGSVLEGLKTARLLPWALWALEVLLQQGGLATLTISPSEKGRMGVQWSKSPATSAPHDALALAVGPGLLGEILQDGTTDWIDGLAGGSATLPPVSGLSLRLPAPMLPDLPVPSALADFLALVHRLRASDWAEAAQEDDTWDFRKPGIPYRGREYDIVRRAVKGGPVYPHLRDGRRHIGFLLPVVEFGGVEKVALNIGRSLRAQGWVPHAIIVEARDIALTPDWSEVFESTIFLLDPQFQAWGGHKQVYGGTPIPNWATEGHHATALGAMHWLDAVVNFHGGAMAGVMGELRRLGLRTLNSLHLNDQTVFGRPVGNTTLGLAYEHAFDLFLPCSDSLGHWLHAMGVPQDKIVVVPNAPAFDVPRPLASAAQTDRHQRPKDAPLRVLFLGRLDRQKGLDRLIAVMRGVQARDLNMEWRIIGKAVMTENLPPLAEEFLEILEPPLDRSEDIARIYGWADVLILLSSFEGLPLTVLEAQRMGVVVIATDVGALRDAVQDGENGVLLPLDEAVPGAIAALARLATDPDWRRGLSARAFATQQTHSWSDATTALAEWLDRMVPQA